MGSADAVPAGSQDDDPGAAKLLRQRDFALYWWSGMLSSPGNWLHNVTASVLILTMTGSPLMVGIVNFAIFIPTLLFSLPAGALGDRVNRRHLVTAAASGGAAMAGTLTVLSATGRLTAWLLVGLCFLIGTANAMAKPALSAMIPMIVPRPAIARATALNVMQFQFGQIVGPLMASVLLLTATPAWGFGINAVTYAGPIIAMRLIRLSAAPRATAPAGAAQGSARARGSIVQGLQFIRRTRPMVAILVSVVLSNGAVEALRTLAPVIASDLGDPGVAGVIIAGYSVGSLAGLLAFGLIEKVLPRRWMLVAAFGLQAIGVTAVALAPGLLLTVVAAAPIGIGFSLSTPLLSASLQELSTDDYRSRVMSTFSMAHLGLRPVFALVAGGVAGALSSSVALGGFAAVAMGAAVFVRRRRVAGD